MKVTIELPVTTACAFVNYVYVADNGETQMAVKSLDANDLDEFRKGETNEKI